ncbi:hypothetical protein LEM9268_00643 [Leuconostoc mesenteroides]|nr:hypothetical protein C7M43_01339 [Leuconostoc mesenteroides]TDV95550.1 hypothetical protein C7818_10160 [Leuconostoc mesenteroides]SPE12565.1 hypothetical protein LEM9268_00643 [Leuconostoc mesenteroides]STY38516.1 Uncharacterised protein [Leuconostoc mesenteroides]
MPEVLIKLTVFGFFTYNSKVSNYHFRGNFNMTWSIRC